MSPALLSKRLKELERAAIITSLRKPNGVVEYHLSEAGEELRPVIVGLGAWAQKWMESRLSLKNLDASLLMWDMRRNLDIRHLPQRRCTIQFLYRELTPNDRSWWLVVEQGKVDLCNFDPGYELDLQVRSSLRSMTAIWMGLSTVGHETDLGEIDVEGDPALARSIQAWLGLSTFAKLPRQVQ